MKFKTAVLVGFILLLACGPAFSGEEERAAEIEAAETVLDALHRSASEADGARYFACFADDAVFLGTDPGERWTLEAFRAFAEPYFSAGRGWTYEVRERHVSFGPEARTAWFDEVLWNASYGTCRGTGVLVLTDGEWRIAQYSLSIPIPNELAADVVAMIEAGTEP